MSKILIVLLFAALITPSLALDATFSESRDGQTTTSILSFDIGQSASLQSSYSGGFSTTRLEGAGYLRQDGLEAVNDAPGISLDVASDGRTTSIRADGEPLAWTDGQMAMSTNRLNIDGSQTIAGPISTVSGGNANAYTFLTYKWNQRDPQIKWVLKNDANMVAEGLSASEVQSAIFGASETWDAASNQNLFADNGLITLNPNVATEIYNKINTINWRSFGPSICLAYTKTAYKLDNINGKRSALDSDIVFNSDYSWRTDGSWNGADVRTVALHEMGHSLGLGDLYGKPEFKYDTRQVMHYYTDVKRTLGNGDAAGIWKLYG